MRKPTRFRPNMQILEDRTTPATVRFLGNLLFVSNPVGDLTLEAAEGGDEVTVTDDRTSVTLPTGSRVIVRGTNGSDDITYQTDAGDVITADILIDSRGGRDTIQFKGGAEFRGDLTLLTGRGNDAVDLSPTGGADYFGDVSVIDQRGDDTVTVATSAAKSDFSGDVALTGFNDITIGTEEGGQDSFLGDVTVNSIQEGPVEVSVAGKATFGGDFTLSTGNGDDIIEIANFDNGGDSAFGGSLSITTGITGAGDLLLIGNGVDPLTVEEGLSIVTSPSDDLVGIAAGVAVANDASIDLGEGLNGLVLDPDDGTNLPFSVDGNLTITAGAGDDNIAPLNAIVGGTLNVDLGSGDNTLTNGDNLSGVNFEVGGGINYTGGNGIDVVTLDGLDAGGLGTDFGDVNLDLGNGDDIVTLGSFADSFGGVNITGGNGNSTFVVGGDVNGKLRLTTGNGDNTLTLGDDGGEFYDVDLRFGNGDDLLLFPIDGVSVTGFIDGGNGTNTGNNIPNAVSPLTVINFVLTDGGV